MNVDNEFLKYLNTVLVDLDVFRSKHKPINVQTIKEIEEGGEQGESGISYEIYKLQYDLYIKLEINTDSYGYNEFVGGIQFVKPKQKTISVYEKIN